MAGEEMHLSWGMGGTRWEVVNAEERRVRVLTFERRIF